MSKVAIVACDTYEPLEVKRCIARLIELLGGCENIFGNNKQFFLKPNLCLPAKPQDGITTHPEVMNAIINIIKEYDNNLLITIGDSPVGKADEKRLSMIWETTMMKLVAMENNCMMNHMNDSFVFREFNCKPASLRYLIHDVIEQPTMIINVPKFKTHGLMVLSGAIKNLYGLIPDGTKKWLHRRFPKREEFAELLIDIYNQTKPKINIVDAIVSLEGEGPGVKGKTKKIGLLLASESAIAIDFVLARIMNIDPMLVPTNKAWVSRFGGEPDIEIVGDLIENYISDNFQLPSIHRYENEDIVKKMFGLKYSKPVINNEVCFGCGICEKNCSISAINFVDGKYIIDVQKCIGCLICHEICPSGAVFIKSNNFYYQLSDM